MSKDMIIGGILGIIIGFVLSKVIKIIKLTRYQNDVARTLIDCLKYENELIRDTGEENMIEYTTKRKGKDYAVYYYGQIYHMLTGASHQDSEPQTVEVVNALRSFLSEALKRDVEEFKENRDKKAKKKK